MLYRLPTALRSVGAILLTGWLAAFLVVSADPRLNPGSTEWALRIGLALVAIGVALDYRPIRALLPFLRTPAYQLAELVTRWNTEIALLDADHDSTVAETRFIALRQLDGETESLLEKQFTDWKPFYDLNQQDFHRRHTNREARELAEHRRYFLRNHLNDIHGGRQRYVI